jgi:ketosteroid isomerase-like protein
MERAQVIRDLLAAYARGDRPAMEAEQNGRS